MIQQRGGVQLKDGLGDAGDVYERHADAVADAVVAGEPAQALLSEHMASENAISPVQRSMVQRSAITTTEEAEEDSESLQTEEADADWSWRGFVEGALEVLMFPRVPPVVIRQIGRGIAKYWPTGTHFMVEGLLGITPVVPFFGCLECGIKVRHEGEGVLDIERRAVVKAAVDTGIGYGFNFGGDSKKKSGDILATAAVAEVQAGQHVKINDHWRFDLCNYQGLIGLYEEFRANPVPKENSGGTDNPSSSSCLSLKVEIGLFAEANAEANASIATASENTPVNRSQKTTKRGGGLDTGKRNWWQDLTSIKAFANAGIDAGVAIELREDNGKYFFELSGSASAISAFAENIPFLPPLSFSRELAGGVKVSFPLNNSESQENSEPQEDSERSVFGSPTYTLFTKTGDLDDFRSAGSEVGVSVRDGSNGDGRLDMTDVVNSVEAISVMSRMGVGVTLGRKQASRQARQDGLRVLLPKKYKSIGVSAGGMLTVEAYLSRKVVMDLLETWGTFFQGRDAWTIFKDLLAFLTTGVLSDEYTEVLQTTLGYVRQGLKRVELQTNAGVAGSAGGELEAVAKVRLDGNGYIGIGQKIDLFKTNYLDIESLTDQILTYILHSDGVDINVDLLVDD